jgi:Tol biopolymer transport system component
LLVSPQGDRTVTVTRASLGARNIFGWSPNGRRIAFSADNSDSGSKLDVVDLATDNLRTLRSPAGTDVAWSPDSRRLLVTADCKIWRVSAVGSRRPRLVRTGSSDAPC